LTATKCRNSKFSRHSRLGHTTFDVANYGDRLSLAGAKPLQLSTEFGGDIKKTLRAQMFQAAKS
jgi:hypothetical protein